MKKIFISLLLIITLGCVEKTPINTTEQENRLWCREAVDSILSYMPEWKEVHSGYIKSPFFVGQREYEKISLSVVVVKGKDTLEISADEFQAEYRGNSIERDSAWVGEVGRINIFEETPSVIKRHNLLMKELFSGVPGFTLEVQNHFIKAKYVKFKPQRPQRPLKDYGLTEEDVNGVDTALNPR